MTVQEILRLDSVSAGYNRIPVIRDIHLIMRAGDTLAVVGANGAGKTTLLRAIMGEIPAMAGQVLFDAQPLDHVPTYARSRLGIGYVPEGRQLFPAMSVHENLELGAYKEARLERDRRVEKILGVFPKLQSLYKTPCGLLSGGEQQMVAIARALMGQPRLLLLDEPSTGLAPKIISELYASLGDLLGSGLTILVVEQNARAALRFATSALVFEGGQIAASGAASELISDPRVVRAYMGMTGEAR